MHAKLDGCTHLESGLVDNTVEFNVLVAYPLLCGHGEDVVPAHHLQAHPRHVVHTQLHLRHPCQEGEEEHAHATHVLRHMTIRRLLHIHLIHSGQLDLLRLVGERTIAMHVNPEEPLFNADRELFHVLVADAGELQQLGDLRCMLQRHAQLFHVAGKLLDALIVGVLHCLGKEADLVGQLLHLGDLAWADAGPLLVEDVLELDGEDLAVLVEDLVSNV